MQLTSNSGVLTCKAVRLQQDQYQVYFESSNEHHLRLVQSWPLLSRIHDGSASVEMKYELLFYPPYSVNGTLPNSRVAHLQV
jgi:hypothetical protein